MRGITPVIAIILLLLMAVAAAGGFYLLYQGFTEEGEESGSTQIEQLGEQSLAAIQIESAAGGRIYVKNVGASDIDLSQVSVYVENVPYSVNTSSDTLAERNRAVLKFTQPPSCSSDSCEVKISGAASASKSVDLAKLLCSSDADCYSSETCEGGVCVEGEGETAVCGDGTCDASEHGYDCWEDCHPDSLAVLGMENSFYPAWLMQYDWNGTTYDFVENATDTSGPAISIPLSYFPLANGNHIVSSLSQNGVWDTCWYSQYDGSSWSYPYNLSNEYEVAFSEQVAPWPDVDSSGNAMFVWTYVEEQPVPNGKVQWSLLSNGVASSPANVSDWVSGYGGDFQTPPSFAFAPDNSGFALYKNVSNLATHNNHKVLYSHWDGSSWDDTGVVANFPNVLNAHTIALTFPLVSFSDNGDAMAVWAIRNKTNHVFHKYATHDGSSWTYQGNFEGWTVTNQTPSYPYDLAHDHQDMPVVAAMGVGVGGGDAYFTYDGTWSENQTMPEGSGKLGPSIYEMPDGTLFLVDLDIEALAAGERSQWRWTVWNGDGWSDPVYVGPWEAA